MRDEMVPSEHTAARAALLWRKMLASPVFDNGDNSFAGVMSQGLAAMIPTNTNDTLLEQFEAKLREVIVTPDAERKDYYPASYLSVDYGPCEPLENAAKAVGLNVQFPWKTNMNVYRDYLTLRAGYSSETQYHYRLDNGKWLVTTLNGSEVEKIKRYVLDGTLPEFSVED